ncbi:hypothetical protein B6U82_01550, partial [Candidatus Pacearchaeota archaeon ex4484_31]
MKSTKKVKVEAFFVLCFLLIYFGSFVVSAQNEEPKIEIVSVEGPKKVGKLYKTIITLRFSNLKKGWEWGDIISYQGRSISGRIWEEEGKAKTRTSYEKGIVIWESEEELGERAYIAEVKRYNEEKGEWEVIKRVYYYYEPEEKSWKLTKLPPLLLPKPEEEQTQTPTPQQQTPSTPSQQKTPTKPKKPKPPKLISPGGPSEEKAEVITTTTPTFEWEKVEGADYYALYISHEPYGPSNLVYSNPKISGTSFKLPEGYLRDGVKYRWNMRAYSKEAGWSDYSSRLYFIVDLSQTHFKSPSKPEEGPTEQDYTLI